MATTGTKSGAPNPPQRTASVTFIDNRLPDIHPAFEHPRIQYDPGAGTYVPTASMSKPAGQATVIPPRPNLPEVNAMKFWSHIFPESMEKLKTLHQEAEGRCDTEWSIRQDKDWQAVRTRLENAQAKYDVPKKTVTTKMRFRRLYRKAADNAEQWKAATKVASHAPYVSPFIAAIDILLDAAAMASKVREEVSSAFNPEALADDFESIEFFMDTFPEDARIKEASIDLVASILKAIEDAIGFFTSGQGSRTWAAVSQGDDYQKKLLDSIGKIQTRSTKLASQARKADMHNSRVGIDKVLKAVNSAEEKTIKAVNSAEEKTIKAVDERDTRMINRLLELFRDPEEAAQRRIEEIEHRVENVEQLVERAERVEHLLGDIRDELRRRNTPSPCPSPFFYYPSTPQPQQAILAAPSFSPPVYMPVPIYPQPAWLLSPDQQLPPPQYQAQVPILTAESLLALLNVPVTASREVSHILSLRYRIVPSSRRRAEAALSTYEFRHWLTGSSSRKLLIQGDPDSDGEELSAISLLSTLVYSTAKIQKGYVPLVWFCSLHDEESAGQGEDGNDIAHVGPRGMVRGFISQILLLHPVDLSGASGINLDKLKKADFGESCELLGLLLRRLPREIKLVVVIDEIGKYEAAEYEEDMLRVLEVLLRAVRGEGVSCTVKLLVTSSDSTDRVADEFCNGDDGEDDDCLIDFSALEEGEDMGEHELESKLGRDEEEGEDGEDSDED